MPNQSKVTGQTYASMIRIPSRDFDYLTSLVGDQYEKAEWNSFSKRFTSCIPNTRLIACLEVLSSGRIAPKIQLSVVNTEKLDDGVIFLQESHSLNGHWEFDWKDDHYVIKSIRSDRERIEDEALHCLDWNILPALKVICSGIYATSRNGGVPLYKEEISDTERFMAWKAVLKEHQEYSQKCENLIRGVLKSFNKPRSERLKMEQSVLEQLNWTRLKKLYLVHRVPIDSVYQGEETREGMIQPNSKPNSKSDGEHRSDWEQVLNEQIRDAAMVEGLIKMVIKAYEKQVK